MAAENTTPHGLTKYSSPLDPFPGRAGHNAMVDRLNLIPGCGVGPLSSRPVPASGLRFWVDEATSRISVNMGTVWAEIAPIGGATPTSVAVAGTASEGTSPRAARADHTHPLPLATTTAPGAMSAADRALLNAATATPASNSLVKYGASGQVRSANPQGHAQDVINQGYLDANFEPIGPWIDMILGTLWEANRPVQYRRKGQYYELRGVLYTSTPPDAERAMLRFPATATGVLNCYTQAITTNIIDNLNVNSFGFLALYTAANTKSINHVAQVGAYTPPLQYVHLDGILMRHNLT